MATTYLQLVNKVLVRLREDEVSSVTQDANSKLIAEFVKEALSEVQDARDWSCLRSTIQVVTGASDYNYSLTDAGESYNILHVYEDTEDYELKRAPSYAWMNERLLANDVQSDQPAYYDVNGVDGNGDPIVNLYPVPDGIYNVNFNMKIKTVLSADTDTITVPELPVVLRAYQHAVDERGDDSGDTLPAIEIRFQRALADAVAYDATNYPDESTWWVE